MRRKGLAIGVGVGTAALAVLVLSAGKQAKPTPGAARAAAVPHGTPPGWTFAWPAGDPAKGREVFAKLECWSCHEVKGEAFPVPTERDALGPELSHMRPLHEPAFVAESVINPRAVIDPAYAAPDGSSRMPSFNDAMTVQEAIDLVAYLAALRPPDAGHAPAPGRNDGDGPVRRGGHTH